MKTPRTHTARQIDKATWTSAGGLSNPRCYRKHTRRGWLYFIANL